MSEEQNNESATPQMEGTDAAAAGIERSTVTPRMSEKKKKPMSRRILKLVLNVVVYVGFVALLVWGLPIGLSRWLKTEYPMAAITSGSMWPELKVGDLILVQAVSAEELKVGDIVVYTNERGFTIHRIKEIDTAKGEITTRGDANNVDDKPVAVTTVIGRTLNWSSGKPVRIPKLGFISIMVSKKVQK
ncbi:MAG: signal peptidase, endoplasmic reticulum-type [Parcubacteria group bacterium Gr01-1014_31]|nr:MAG: signal peptidase, endoplasmic reticulum-type [Parcubacteria group bacterium Gr01-1014_31]